MMTGTPTGESVFFPNIKHIKVKKEETRIKELNVFFVQTKNEQLIEMTRSMAQDILAGKKILFPTNRGITYFEEIIGLVQQHLTEKHFGREIKSFYYKKSNYGDQSMEDINRSSTVGENDIVGCSTYLSVGVDICDRGTFSIYFDELWISQDIEQFANRIRNNDLFVKIFLPKFMCDSCNKVLKDNNVEIQYYSIGIDFKPYSPVPAVNEYYYGGSVYLLENYLFFSSLKQ